MKKQTKKKTKKLDEIQEAIKEKGARWTAGETPVSDLSDEQKRNLLGLVRSQKTKQKSDKKK
ncbi:MAG: hypothetical protein LUQ38_01815 [Methanotrichaceae archaeon]|nr:hypothetical protein [Methanotrichaceae archaeon]